MAATLGDTAPVIEIPSPPRRCFPAWMLSMSFHGLVLILLAICLRQPAQKEKTDIDRSVDSVGIVLSTRTKDVAYKQQLALEQSHNTKIKAQSSSNLTESPSAAMSNLFPQTTEMASNSASGSNPELPGELEIASAQGNALQGLIASGGGRPQILPGLGDEEILANDPLRIAQQVELGPTATVSIFGSAATGRSFAFLIDRSRSMGGEGLGAIEAAEKELSQALKSLTPHQNFQIIAYNQSLSATDPSMLPATVGNQMRAEKFLAGIVAFGQTEHRKALYAALREKPEVIYLFTDGGEPGLTAPEIRNFVLASRGKTIVHCVHFGYGALQEKDSFLQQLARRCGGGYAYINMTVE